MKEIAERTGGRAYYNANDVEAGVRQAFDDIAATYSLGYYLTEDDAKPGLHRVQIRIDNKEARLRYAEEYTAAGPGATESRAAEASRAMLSPSDSTTISLTILTGKRDGRLAIKIAFDVRSLMVANEQAHVELLTRFAAANGQQSGELGKSEVNLHLKPEAYEEALRNGISVQQVFSIPPNATTFRALIQDLDSGKIDTVTVALADVTAR